MLKTLNLLRKTKNHNLILNYIISIYSSKDCVKEIWMIWTSLHNFDHDRTKINHYGFKITELRYSL